MVLAKSLIRPIPFDDIAGLMVAAFSATIAGGLAAAYPSAPEISSLMVAAAVLAIGASRLGPAVGLLLGELELVRLTTT